MSEETGSFLEGATQYRRCHSEQNRTDGEQNRTDGDSSDVLARLPRESEVTDAPQQRLES